MRWRLAPPRVIALLGAGGASLVLALTGGDLSNGALRAGAVVALVAGAGTALRGRRAGAASPPLVTVMERQVLARETGVALVAAEGRRLLVGYGPAGVALLVELGPPEERLP